MEQPTTCASCNGPLLPDEPIDLPRGLDAKWAAHKDFNDRLKTILVRRGDLSQDFIDEFIALRRGVAS